MLRGHSGALILAGILSALTGAAFAQNAGSAEPADADGILNVGIVRYIRPSPHEPVIEPTIAALKARFGAANVATVALTMDELTRAIRDKKVDVFIASAGFYRFNVIHGARDLVTLASRAYPDPNHGDGSVFVTLASTPFDTIESLKGSRLVAATPTGFTSLRIAQGELAARGYNPEKFFRQSFFTGPGNTEAAVEMLKSHKADTAVFRLCWLENHLKAHPEEKKSLARRGTQTRFRTVPCLHRSLPLLDCGNDARHAPCGLAHCDGDASCDARNPRGAVLECGHGLQHDR